MQLSSTQIERFRTDGYLVIEGFADPEQCAALRSRAGELETEHRADLDHVTVFSTGDQAHSGDDWFLTSGGVVRGFFESDGNRLNKLGHAMHDLDPVFDEFCRSRGLREVASSIGIDDPKLVQSMYIFKHPGIGGEVTWHTDHTFLWTEPRSVVGFWLAIDDATVDNGCMWAIPGGHRIPVKARFHLTSDRSAATTTVIDDSPYPIDDAVALEADSGTLILLDGALPHWSDVNRSAQPRQAFTLHVVDGTTDWVDDNWLQRPDEMPFRGFD